MVDYKVTDTQLTSIADAIRTKGGTSASLVFPSGFVSAIGSIPTGGGTLISKTITQNGLYSAADDNADGYSDVIVNVSGGSSPVLVSKSISQNGTYNPSDDNADAYSQVVVNVSGGGSDDNFLITCGAMSGSIYDTNVSKVIKSLFANNTFVTGVEMASASAIESSAFYYCTNLTAISFPSCVSISASAFYNCRNLSSVYLPMCETISSNTFYFCDKIREIDLPACKTIGTRAFYYGYSLSKVTLRSCTRIEAEAFCSCSRLAKLIILTESVCSLGGRDVFDNSALRYSMYLGYFGSVYVPASLVESYKSAGIWSTISDRITSYVEE